MLGVGMALVFLIGFALIATQLLQFTGLVLAGGLLLLWVAYNMYRELRHAPTPVRPTIRDAEVEGPPRARPSSRRRSRSRSPTCR
jgi:predicted tellurium resistance membrane protein TerC